MVNGLGVLGWGVGGIEAEAAMLGQPLSMLLPPVVGLRISGELRPGTTATDVVLTVTELLRDHGVVGAFVECYGPGVAALPLETRATIGNMSPEYGATCTMFPIDQVTIDYMRFTGRDEDHLALVEAYAKEQGLWHTADGIEPVYSEYATLDLGDVEPSLAGPSRPQDRVALAGAGDAFRVALDRTPRTSDRGAPGGSAPPPGGRGRRRGGDHQLHQHLEPPGHGGGRPAGPERRGAGPAGEAVGQDLARPGLPGGHGLPRAGPARGAPRAAGVLPGRLRLHHLHRQFGPAAGRGQRTGAQRRPLRGLGALGQPELRGSDPPRRADELPGLAPAGRRLRAGGDDGHRSDHRSPGGGRRRKRRCFWRTSGPASRRSAEAVRASLTSEMFRTRYGAVFEGDEYWGEVPVAEGETFSWQDDSTYVKNPPFFEGMTMTPTPVSDIEGARVLAMVGDSVTTDHISPAGSIGPDTPAGRYLAEHGVPRNDFNSYGARRGNHEVMMRGTFANVRLRNRLAPGTEGGYTLHLPDGTETSIYEAAMQYADESVPLIVLAGREYGTGSSRDWAAKGTALLGVRAVIAQSFERIHRSNLVGMGVIPLQFYKGDSAESLALTGDGELHHHGDRRPQRGRAAQRVDRDRHGGRRVDHRVQGDRPYRHPDGGRVLPSRRDSPLRPAPVGRLTGRLHGARASGPFVHRTDGKPLTAGQGMRVTRNSSAVAPSGSPARAPEARPPSVTRRATPSGSSIWLLWQSNAATLRSMVDVVSTATLGSVPPHDPQFVHASRARALPRRGAQGGRTGCGRSG